MLNKHKKVILWGAKPDTGHTHQFVHDAFHRAAQFLQIPVFWVDNRDNLAPEFFDDSLIISEQWLVFPNGLSRVSDNLPLRKSSTYVIHYLGNAKHEVRGNPGASMYLGKVGRLIDYRLACDWGTNGVPDENYTNKFTPEKYVALSDSAWFERGPEYDCFYAFWGTDLLPYEIDYETRHTPFADPKYAFFGGTIREDNHEMFGPFLRACADNKLPFVYNTPWERPLSIADIREAVIKSYLPLDLRPANHLANNYVSCRLFKNISYGALGLTNSIAAYEFFDGNIAFSADPENLFYVARDMQDRASTKERILHCMEKVKRHHTYINRLQDIITASEI